MFVPKPSRLVKQFTRHLGVLMMTTAERLGAAAAVLAIVAILAGMIAQV
jgi:hypothetical protein